jgi:hypothetical protein
MTSIRFSRILSFNPEPVIISHGTPDTWQYIHKTNRSDWRYMQLDLIFHTYPVIVCHYESYYVLQDSLAETPVGH